MSSPFKKNPDSEYGKKAIRSETPTGLLNAMKLPGKANGIVISDKQSNKMFTLDVAAPENFRVRDKETKKKLIYHNCEWHHGLLVLLRQSSYPRNI